MSLSRPTEETGLFERILIHRAAFCAVFFCIFLLTYGILFLIDFIPETPTEAEDAAPAAIVEMPAPQSDMLAAPRGGDPYPRTIVIDALGKEITVQNPESRSVTDLDAALLSGVVRHPDSADFVRSGNVFLFGHSSYLPQVFNKNFQAFNDIQKLSWGDIIRVQSTDMEYRYRVNKVYRLKASEAKVSLDGDAPRLTLVTCNSFGSKDDRFVVEAELVETVAL